MSAGGLPSRRAGDEHAGDVRRANATQQKDDHVVHTVAASSILGYDRSPYRNQTVPTRRRISWTASSARAQWPCLECAIDFNWTACSHVQRDLRPGATDARNVHRGRPPAPRPGQSIHSNPPTCTGGDRPRSCWAGPRGKHDGVGLATNCCSPATCASGRNRRGQRSGRVSSAACVWRASSGGKRRPLDLYYSTAGPRVPTRTRAAHMSRLVEQGQGAGDTTVFSEVPATVRRATTRCIRVTALPSESPCLPGEADGDA